MIRANSLSIREVEIAAHYAGGANYHEIATQLFIAPSTVRSHLAAIYRKLEVSSTRGWTVILRRPTHRLIRPQSFQNLLFA